MAIQRKAKTRLPEVLNLRLPTDLPPAIQAAAEQRYLSVSEFVRLALINQLAADGFNPRALNAHAA